MRFPSVALLSLLAVAVSADEAKKVLPKRHTTDHAIIEEELKTVTIPKEQEKSFTCTLTGATGQDQCDAATDDDGSKCVWCVLNNFGFCVSAEQAQQFEQIMPTIDCDDSADDDKTPAADDDKAPDDGPLFNCLEKKDENSCGDACVWCNTKGGFGVCLTTEAADLAKGSYWFDCPAEEEEERTPAGQEDEDEEEMEEDWNEGEEEEGEDYEEEEWEEDEGMHEFVVDTNCVLSGMLLDPTDDEATSESACFQARDMAGNPCEWCAVSGSPFRICLSEPQAQVAEYVGAVCTGSDESFEPEDFDDSCIAHMHEDPNLGKEGCWMHKDLDGNGCEWCNIMGVELCLGGVQAELVEHWGATCVLDHKEHAMAQAAIEEHKEYVLAKKEAERIQKQAEGVKEEPTEEDEEDIDLDTLWLTSDSSCMVTTLRVSGGDDELACAQTQDAEGNPCNWCQMGTSFYMCLNDEQADVAEYLGIQCETISTETQEILRNQIQRAEEEDEEESEDEEEEDYENELMNDVEDFDNSCIMTMINGPDQSACVSAKDQDGQACEWCSWNQFQVCLAAEQAEMVEPFGVKCDSVTPRRQQPDLPSYPVLQELTASIDTSCLIEAGQYNDPEKCTSAKDSVGKPCEWCSLGSLGFNACMSAEQAQLGRPLGVTCQSEPPAPEHALLQTLPQDFFSCLSQSTEIDECDETCTWCDLKGSSTGAGLCLSDPIADAVLDLYPNGPLDCAEPEGEEYDEEEEYDSEDDEEESDSEDEEESDSEDEEEEAAEEMRDEKRTAETMDEETA